MMNTHEIPQGNQRTCHVTYYYPLRELRIYYTDVFYNIILSSSSNYVYDIIIILLYTGVASEREWNKKSVDDKDIKLFCITYDENLKINIFFIDNIYFYKISADNYYNIPF